MSAPVAPDWVPKGFNWQEIYSFRFLPGYWRLKEASNLLDFNLLVNHFRDLIRNNPEDYTKEKERYYKMKYEEQKEYGKKQGF